MENKFKEKYAGNSKRGTIVITNQDHKWTSFGLSPVDLNIINSMGLSKAAIAEVYGVPTVMLSYRDWETDRKSTRLNSSHSAKSRMPSSA